MRVLFTGASSFTGAWFVRALAEAGAEVVAPLRGGLDDGGAARQARLATVEGVASLHAHAALGSARLHDLAAAGQAFDLVCLHAAEVGDFRKPGYDPLAAAAAGTAGLGRLLDASRCRAALVTGSVFEADEGIGDAPLPAVGGYGLAKTLAWQTARFEVERRGLTLGKLTIAHPFGPLEKDGLTRGLLEAWAKNAPARIQHPRLVRDLVPVRWLARAYLELARDLVILARPLRRTPSGFAEPLGAFATRMATALRPLLGRRCAIDAASGPAPSDEPAVRIGCHPLSELADHDEVATMWHAYAKFS